MGLRGSELKMARDFRLVSRKISGVVFVAVLCVFFLTASPGQAQESSGGSAAGGVGGTHGGATTRKAAAGGATRFPCDAAPG